MSSECVCVCFQRRVEVKIRTKLTSGHFKVVFSRWGSSENILVID